MSSHFLNAYDLDSWYLVHCQPRREMVATRALQRIFNIAVYYPQYQRHAAGEHQAVAFFPGYIFARVDLQKVPLSQINTAPGVLHLVSFGDAPTPIPHATVQELAQRLEHLDRSTPTPFASGDVVRFKQGGPLQGLEMIFVGPAASHQRVRVLLTFLGRQQETAVDLGVLEKLPAAPGHPRKRSTRGRGRRIKYAS